MNARAVLAHCWTGHPDAGWYPRLREDLGAMGLSVTVPALPDPDRPSLPAWLDTLSAAIGAPGGEVRLIGHSLGALALLHWLARAGDGVRVADVLLVAPPLGETGLADVDRFLAPPPDLAAARRHAARFDAVLSVADPYLRPDPLHVARRLADELGAHVRLVPDRGHFAPASGQTPLPEVRQWAAAALPSPLSCPDEA